ncbi:hypothetical protein H4W81_003037 [Nonomuraea africana]|uniref:Uncharacterized protein n=1 Tax=Nonomuraea africana TaxID=46171 RepID=A0ABR9KE14_9ACTN|nr:hypothetical protein [Nonomuraea africana]MBE1560258.1 hypothetical protein [Nonomuraea africana]
MAWNSGSTTSQRSSGATSSDTACSTAGRAHHDAAARVPDDVPQLCHAGLRVGGHDDRADQGGAEPAGQELGAVVQHQGDPITPADARTGEDGGAPLREPRGGRVVEPGGRLPVVEREERRVRRRRRPGGQQRSHGLAPERQQARGHDPPPRACLRTLPVGERGRSSTR